MIIILAVSESSKNSSSSSQSWASERKCNEVFGGNAANSSLSAIILQRPQFKTEAQDGFGEKGGGRGASECCTAGSGE
jgi:hypothetical protein